MPWFRALTRPAALLSAATFAALFQLTPAHAAPPAWPPLLGAGRTSRACSDAAPGTARCHALIRVAAQSQAANDAPQGYGPTDLQAAYRLPSGGSAAGTTVAIVDAYDDPSAESDLAVYRAHFGLPACTTATGCFRKVNQDGSPAPLPSADSDWSVEISLDLDMVSAVCPNCRILLVVANSSGMSDLGTGVNTAAALGARAISNSYGESESSAEAAYDTLYFNHPGIAVTASSGDDGYGVEYPSASRNVVAVGGTTLARASSGRGWSETVWSGSGSGCSAYISKPAWQTDTACSRRTVADVSAVADPATGLAVYDSSLHGGQSGWLVGGGTSAAAPIIAAVYAMAGRSPIAGKPAEFPYLNPQDLFEVVSGSNGDCGTYLCKAGNGYNGPSGLGTPDGTAAFSPSASGPPATISTVPSATPDSANPLPSPSSHVPSASQVASSTPVAAVPGPDTTRSTPQAVDPAPAPAVRSTPPAVPSSQPAEAESSHGTSGPSASSLPGPPSHAGSSSPPPRGTGEAPNSTCANLPAWLPFRCNPPVSSPSQAHCCATPTVGPAPRYSRNVQA